LKENIKDFIKPPGAPSSYKQRPLDMCTLDGIWSDSREQNHFWRNYLQYWLKWLPDKITRLRLWFHSLCFAVKLKMIYYRYLLHLQRIRFLKVIFFFYFLWRRVIFMMENWNAYCVQTAPL